MEFYNWSLEKNVGNADKTVRTATAMSLIAAAFNKKISTSGRILLLLGSAALLATSITGKCPAYQAAGIDTRNYHK